MIPPTEVELYPTPILQARAGGMASIAELVRGRLLLCNALRAGWLHEVLDEPNPWTEDEP